MALNPVNVGRRALSLKEESDEIKVRGTLRSLVQVIGLCNGRIPDQASSPGPGLVACEDLFHGEVREA